MLDERAPFLSWTIHTNPVFYAMAVTAMYWYRPKGKGLQAGAIDRVIDTVVMKARRAATASVVQRRPRVLVWEVYERIVVNIMCT